MSEQSLRLSPGTPPDAVIAAFNGLADRVDRFVFLQTLRDVTDEPDDVKAAQAAPIPEPLTQADVRQAVEHAVRETRSGIPDATAEWTLHLGPGCTVENTESGNRFSVEAGNAIPLDADVKLRVLDKAEAMIDPRAKAKASPITVHDVRRMRVDGRNGEWMVPLDRSIRAGSIAYDQGANLTWVTRVRHDEAEGVSIISPPGH